ncbi:MAG: LacI family transcriptional regulator [Firmicutes bacterium]|nr:LacI family transcriptional regulator [Bacillota bacterium]
MVIKVATINDIAKLAKVSKSTVSRVINNYPDVNDETRQKIIKIMQKNNYWPKTVARSLSTNKSYTIGLFVPTNMNNFFFREVIQGIEYTLGELGYDLLYFTHQKNVKYYIDTGIKFNFVEKSIDKHVDGLIMLGFNTSNMDRFKDLVESNIPTVFIDIKIESENSTYVTSDNFRGARKAISYLYEIGHRDIGILLGHPEVQPSQERYKGCVKAFEELGLSLNQDWIYRVEYLHKEGYQALQEILAMKKQPTAIFAEDMIAIGAIRAIRDAGLSIPGDFSIIGFDNIELSYHYDLTTVNQDQYEMGAAASRILVKIINDGDVNPAILPVEVIVRGSCRSIK